jgi:hypothetical protein
MALSAAASSRGTHTQIEEAIRPKEVCLGVQVPRVGHHAQRTQHHAHQSDNQRPMVDPNMLLAQPCRVLRVPNEKGVRHQHARDGDDEAADILARRVVDRGGGKHGGPGNALACGLGARQRVCDREGERHDAAGQRRHRPRRQRLRQRGGHGARGVAQRAAAQNRAAPGCGVAPLRGSCAEARPRPASACGDAARRGGARAAKATSRRSKSAEARSRATERQGSGSGAQRRQEASETAG